MLDGWLNFRSSVPRSETPKILDGNDIFIHGYQGSLDKTLIEATLVGLPIVTINLEYQAEFGAWGSEDESRNSLSKQIKYLKSLTLERLVSELKTRRDIAVEKHSLEKWIEKLIAVLN